MKNYKKALSLMLVLCMTLVSVFAFAPLTANADGGGIVRKYAKTITISKASPAVLIDMGKRIKGAKSVTVTSSKKSVATVAKNGKKFGDPFVTIKKPGTTKITVKVKKGGKTKKYVIKFKVVKYKNAIKSATLAGKNYNKYKKKTDATISLTSGASGKINVKANKGWKVKKIVEYIDTSFEDGDGNYDLKTTTRTVKNGSELSFDFDNNMYFFVITMYKSSGNQIEEYYLYLDEAI